MNQKNSANLVVAKTIKLYIDGEFPRTESGRSFPIYDKSGKTIFANLCLASRKDLRNAVTAAQSAQAAWSQRSAYNRSQIIYRMAEILDSRRQEFLDLQQKVLGLNPKAAQVEVEKSLENLLHYAGWTDKYSQVIGAVNPVAGPHHNFTSPEAMGVVGVMFSEVASLSEIFEELTAIILSGNVAVSLLTGPAAVFISALGEIFATSDLPKGVINLLSGSLEELAPHFASHMEIQGLLFNFRPDNMKSRVPLKAKSPLKSHLSNSSDKKTWELLHSIESASIDNMKRVYKLTAEPMTSLERILRFVEYKTVWHPVGI